MPHYGTIKNYEDAKKELRSQITRLRKTGLTYRLIARDLNKRQVKTIHGKRWTLINVYLFGTGRNVKNRNTVTKGLSRG